MSREQRAFRKRSSGAAIRICLVAQEPPPPPPRLLPPRSDLHGGSGPRGGSAPGDKDTGTRTGASPMQPAAPGGALLSLEPASPARVTAWRDARGPGTFQELVTEPGAPGQAGQPPASLPTHPPGSFCTPRIVGCLHNGPPGSSAPTATCLLHPLLFGRVCLAFLGQKARF